MLKSGPDHPITLERSPRRWRAFFAGHVIADTDDAIVLRESTLDPVVYFPRDSVETAYMSRTERSTHCPYKGDASYYTLLMDGQFAENAAWSYEAPFPAMADIEGRLAFYPDKVEVYSLDDPAVNAGARREASDASAQVDEVILHTDAGGGASQRQAWEPTVDQPASDGGVR